MNEVAGTSRREIGENRDIAQRFTAANLGYDLAFDVPDSKDTGRISGKLIDLAFEVATLVPADIPADIHVTTIEDFYKAGFAALKHIHLWLGQYRNGRNRRG